MKTNEELIAVLQRTAAEIRAQDIAGWGNAIDEAIAALQPSGDQCQVCSADHQFSVSPGHPMRDGKYRCPICLAYRLDSLTDDVNRLTGAFKPSGGVNDLYSKMGLMLLEIRLANIPERNILTECARILGLELAKPSGDVVSVARADLELLLQEGKAGYYRAGAFDKCLDSVARLHSALSQPSTVSDGKDAARSYRAAKHAVAPTRCAANRDGECSHPLCPQLLDGEPAKSKRHCPIDIQDEEV